MRGNVLFLLCAAVLGIAPTVASADPPICPIDACPYPLVNMLDGENSCPKCVYPGDAITVTLACQVASDGTLCSAMPIAPTSPESLNYVWSYTVGSARTKVLPGSKDPLLGIKCSLDQKVLVSVSVANGSYQASKTQEVRCGRASP
jgi:hypothetical protein